MRGKKGKHEITIGILIVLLAVIISLGVWQYVNPSVTGYAVANNQPEKNCREIEIPYEAQEEYLKTEYYTETVPYTDTECETKELSFRSSDDNPLRDVTCIDSHEECKESHTTIFGNVKCDRYETICDKYREGVSFDITNLDSEKGLWRFEWRNSCRNNQLLCNIQDYKSLGVYGDYIDPTETKTFSYQIEYDAKGQEYLFPYLLDIPKKQICRDVIKYREVQKSRQVTAYHPVTKYRTEEVCD